MDNSVLYFLEDDEMHISITEDKLLESIVALELGELLQVEVPEEPKTVKVSAITPRQLALIELIRQGHQHFDKIKVEDGDPMSVSVRYLDDNGFSCKKIIVLDQEH